MIVDLLRNDLSRVCRAGQRPRDAALRPGNVPVRAAPGLGRRRARSRPGKTAVDLLRAAFPGGSITGAPKVRAMEIIAELEPTARGPYCGSLGYFGFDGSLDPSILIRTITAGRGWWQFPVGGGIVAQSSPEREYEETWHKAAGLLRATWSSNDPAHRQLRQLRPQPGPLFPAAGPGDARRAQRRDRRRRDRAACGPRRSCSRPAPARRPKRAARSTSCGTSPAGCRFWASAWAIRRSRRRSAGGSSAAASRCTAAPATIKHDGRRHLRRAAQSAHGRPLSFAGGRRTDAARASWPSPPGPATARSWPWRTASSRRRRAVPSRVDPDRRRIRNAGRLFAARGPADAQSAAVDRPRGP